MSRNHYIGTQLHKAHELAPHEPFFATCATLPHYVIDPSLRALLTRGDVQASIQAMIDAEIMHLPFPEMLIEISTSDEPVRSFVLLQEVEEGFVASMAVYHEAGAVEVDPAPMLIKMMGHGVEVNTSDQRTHETWARIAGISLSIALLMLNIQGVEKQVIEIEQLNRARVKRGVPAVPKHTVLRVGYIYDIHGRRVSTTDGTGRHMPVHMRAGHTRRQHHGPDNSLTKIIFVPPVLVNFKPGDTVQQPKKVIAA